MEERWEGTSQTGMRDPWTWATVQGLTGGGAG